MTFNSAQRTNKNKENITKKKYRITVKRICRK